MRLLIADTETYFDTEYSLKRLTTEEYIRDPRFKTHLLGYWQPDTMAAPADCLPAMLESNEDFRALTRSSALVAHHAHFEALILEHHYGIRPAFWIDTLSMARLVLPHLRSHSLDALAAHFGLPAKTVPYNEFRGVRVVDSALYLRLAAGCRHDVWLTAEIAKRLMPLVPRDELRIIDMTVRMFSEPVLELDRPRMEAFLCAEKIRKAKAMLEAASAIGLRWPAHLIGQTGENIRAFLDMVETELQSANKFRRALESLGYPCPMKWSDKQQCEIPALAKSDDGMKALLEHGDDRVVTLAEARLAVKSTTDETRAETLLATSTRGALPVYLKYAAAKTLRFGGGDATNWQNFRRGGEIRKAILAPQGHKLVIGDLSQIEYRLLCWLVGQTDKLDALREGRDLYCEFASAFYREPITRDDKPRRGVGKQGILMGGYGAGRETMIATAASGGYGPPVYLTPEEGQRMVDTYRGQHPRVVDFWRWCDNTLPALAIGGETTYRHVLRISGQKIHLPNGTALDYTGLKSATNTEIFPDQEPDGKGYGWWEPTRKGWSRLWGSKLTAYIVQALARVVIAAAMVKVGARYKVALQCHDELVGVVPDAKAEQALAWMLEVMRTPPDWCPDIPLEAEGLISDRYDK